MTVQISGTSGYIADFSNATVASRQAFQTSTSNGSTGIYALPNGTSTAASWQATNAADPTNASKVLIATNGSTDVQLVSGRNGTGTYLPLTFYTNGSEQMRLDTSGNLGLGVTPSAWGLGKSFEISLSGNSIWGTGSINDIRVMSNAYFNGTNYKYGSTGYANMYIVGSNTGQHQWYTAASGSAGTNITFTQAMTLDASGNLGVGTTSPSTYSSRLVVESNGKNTGLVVGDLATPANATSIYLRTTGLASFYNAVGGSFSWGENGGSERMRIDSSGNLLVGVTTLANNGGISLRPSAANPYIYMGGSSTSNSDSTYLLYSSGAGAYRFYVGYGGTISATSTTITGISDQRLKENIRDLDDGLAKVMALQPRKFDWKEGKGKGITNDRGFIAQEFEQVFPDMIEEWKDEPPEGEEPYKAVNANLIPTLVKAIQEQQAIITQLQADVAALKAKA